MSRCGKRYGLRNGISLPELLIGTVLISVIALGIYRFYVSATRDSIMGRVKFIMNQRSQVFLEAVKNDLQSMFITESSIESGVYLSWLSSTFPAGTSLPSYQFKSFSMPANAAKQMTRDIRYVSSAGKITRLENGTATMILGDRDNVTVKDFSISHYRTKIQLVSGEVISPHWFRISLTMSREANSPLRDAGIMIVTSVGPRHINGKRNHPHWQALNQFLAP